MKKLSAILVLTSLFLSGHIYAQFNAGIKASVGAGKMNFTGIQSSISPNTKATTSYDFGLFSEIRMGNQFYFQPEINYAHRGFKIEETVNFEVGNFPLEAGGGIYTQINYLQTPLLLKYKFGNSKIKGFVAAGPNINYALNGRINTRANFILDFNVSEHDLDLTSDTYNRWSIAGDMAAGAEIPVASGAIIVEGRYSHNLTESLNIPILDIGVQNRNIGFSVGYRFDF